MPKKIVEDEDLDEEESDEDVDPEEEDDIDEIEQELQATKAKLEKVNAREKQQLAARSNPRIVQQQPQRTNLPVQKQAPEPVQRRYVAFVQQPREGVVDAETNEVVGDNVYSILADVIERLERIESSIGSITG